MSIQKNKTIYGVMAVLVAFFLLIKPIPAYAHVDLNFDDDNAVQNHILSQYGSPKKTPSNNTFYYTTLVFVTGGLLNGYNDIPYFLFTDAPLVYCDKGNGNDLPDPFLQSITTGVRYEIYKYTGDFSWVEQLESFTFTNMVLTDSGKTTGYFAFETSSSNRAVKANYDVIKVDKLSTNGVFTGFDYYGYAYNWDGEDNIPELDEELAEDSNKSILSAIKGILSIISTLGTGIAGIISAILSIPSTLVTLTTDYVPFLGALFSFLPSPIPQLLVSLFSLQIVFLVYKLIRG